MRRGRVFVENQLAGIIAETDDGYSFTYDSSYLASPDAVAASLTLPLRQEPFATKTLHPFFDGLIPEGWVLDIAASHWKVNQKDRMGLLLAVCNDCIGAVSIEAVHE